MRQMKPSQRIGSREASAGRDVLIIACVALLCFALASFFDAFEAIAEAARRHEAWQLDELLTLGLIMAVVTGVFSVRRQRDIRQEIAERRRSEETLALRTRQLEAVRAGTAEITRELDLSKLLMVTCRRAADLLGAPSGTVFLWDEASQALVPAAWHGLGEWRREIRPRLGEGVAGSIAERREGMIVHDYPVSPYAHPPTLERVKITAVVGEPLLYHDQLIGVITINQEGNGSAFTQEDRQTLGLFAAQAAIAIENARLFEEITRRNQELQALFTVTNTVTRSLDIDSITQAAVLTTIEALRLDAGRLYIFDEKAHALRLAAHHGLPPEVLRDFESYAPGQGIIGRIFQQGRPIFFADITTDPNHAAMARSNLGLQLGFRSAAGLPILIQEKPVGVIYLFGRAVREFGREDLALLSAIGGQVGIAIEHARLFADTEQRAAELSALREVGQAITARLDLPAVLEAVVAGSMRLLDNPFGQIILWDEATRALRFGAALGPDADRIRAQTFALGRGINGTVAQTRQPMILNDYQASPHAVPECHDIVATITVPILFGDRLLGVLHSHTITPGRRFTQDDLRRLQVLADQAAVAIENARLHDAARRQAADLEARVRERTAELEEALQVKVEFLGKMSHELRTPLNAVLGFSEILLERGPGNLTPKQERYLGQVHAGGKRLLELVTDLFEISDTQTGQAALQLARLPVRDLVDEVLGPLAVAAKAKQVALGTTLDPRLPAIVADRRMLRQILSKLLDNALKFTPHHGSVRLTVRLADGWNGGGEGQWVEIAVQDTGIGIRAEDLGRIFYGFEQVDSSATRRYGGAGLGLALVRRIVELHGGRVWAESEGEGRGARFIVRLPFLAPPPAQRILVVEDEPHLLEALYAALAPGGYSVEQARTGAEALQRLAAAAPSLIVLDISLPDMDGWSVLKQVRETDRTRGLPVLVLTGLESVRAEQALALGADEFLAKPVSAQVLVETVARLLSRPLREAAASMEA